MGSSQVVHIVDVIVDVPVEEIWARFDADPTSLLADVGTAAECAFAGLPDPSSLGKQPPLAEWQAFPGNRLDAQFVERLSDDDERARRREGCRTILHLRIRGTQQNGGTSHGALWVRLMSECGARIRGATRFAAPQRPVGRLEVRWRALGAAFTRQPRSE